MTGNDNAALVETVRKLDRLTTLSAEDRTAILGIPFKTEIVPPEHSLVREGEVTTQCCVLLDGYACRFKTTSAGERQIVSFHMSGDILDLQHLLLAHADHGVETISEATVAWVDAGALRRVAQGSTAVSDALWRDTLIDASIFREWVLNVGRRDAKSRVAHMLCEFAARRERAGLGSPEKDKLPLTKQHISDATGLMAVHVNRVLHQLARERLIADSGPSAKILDWAGLSRVADFDAAYLHAAA